MPILTIQNKGLSSSTKCGLNGPLPNLTTSELIYKYVESHPTYGLLFLSHHFRVSPETIVSKLHGHKRYAELRQELLALKKKD